MNKRERLIRAAIACGGDWVRISKSLTDGTDYPSVKNPEKCLTIDDSEYPDSLRMLRYPPWVLFYRGNIDLLKMPAATIVGSRMACAYGAGITEKCVHELAKRYVLVSGLAKGIDSVVHRTAIREQRYTIGVIGSGLDTHYPPCNDELYQAMENDHLILSEYPRGTGVRKEHFPWRNRILAALGNPIIVTQAAIRSGTMLTVNEAILLSKDIYCVPYPYGSLEGAGCNLLISQGAMILFDEEQLQQMSPERKELANC